MGSASDIAAIPKLGRDFDGRLSITMRDTESSFDYGSIEPCRNYDKPWNKPFGGLWLSVDNKWEEYCAEVMPEWLYGKAYDVTLRDDAKVLVVDSDEVLSQLPQFDTSGEKHPEKVLLDFNALANDYDALVIDMEHIEDSKRRFYGWSATSMIVMHKDAVESVCERESGDIVYDRVVDGDTSVKHEIDPRLLDLEAISKDDMDFVMGL